jgi:hypothetical protein
MTGESAERGLEMKSRTVVRIPCRSYADVKELALRLEADGYSVARRRRAVIAHTETHKDGEELARKLRLDAVVVNRWSARMRPRRALTLKQDSQYQAADAGRS